MTTVRPPKSVFPTYQYWIYPQVDPSLGPLANRSSSPGQLVNKMAAPPVSQLAPA